MFLVNYTLFGIITRLGPGPSGFRILAGPR